MFRCGMCNVVVGVPQRGSRDSEVVAQTAKKDVDMPKLEEVSTMSVKSLKEVIEACGESTAGITDKSDLQSKVRTYKIHTLSLKLLREDC